MPTSGPRGGVATVVALTEWDSLQALEAAAASESYVQVMSQLSTFFRGSPSVLTMGQEPSNAFFRTVQ